MARVKPINKITHTFDDKALPSAGHSSDQKPELAGNSGVAVEMGAQAFKVGAHLVDNLKLFFGKVKASQSVVNDCGQIRLWKLGRV